MPFLIPIFWLAANVGAVVAADKYLEGNAGAVPDQEVDPLIPETLNEQKTNKMPHYIALAMVAGAVAGILIKKR